MTTTTKELIDWCEAEYDCTAKEKLEEVAQRLRELEAQVTDLELKLLTERAAVKEST